MNDIESSFKKNLFKSIKGRYHEQVIDLILGESNQGKPLFSGEIITEALILALSISCNSTIAYLIYKTHAEQEPDIEIPDNTGDFPSLSAFKLNMWRDPNPNNFGPDAAYRWYDQAIIWS